MSEELEELYDRLQKEDWTYLDVNEKQLIMNTLKKSLQPINNDEVCNIHSSFPGEYYCEKYDRLLEIQYNDGANIIDYKYCPHCGREILKASDK